MWVSKWQICSTEIIQVLEKLNLVIKNYRGQGYDGATNISSEAVDAQNKTKKVRKSRLHSLTVNLNLVITIACKIAIFQNTLDIVKEVTTMFVKVKFGKYNLLNPFLSNGFFLYILKVSENKKISDVLRGVSKGTLKRKGLKSGDK